MTRINLLPWREERKKERQTEFVVLLVFAAALGLGVWFGVSQYLSGVIQYQQSRNDLLQQEIHKLDEKIVKIKDLESTKAKLIARMNVIQRLQQGRPQIVHVFQQIASTLPEGVYLTGLQQKGGSIVLQGVGQSNARVSNYMQNLDGSDWLADPSLQVIQVKDDGGVRVSNFALTVKEENPGGQSEDNMNKVAKNKPRGRGRR